MQDAGTTLKPALTARHIIHTLLNEQRHLVILLLGFSAGLPAALTASTLQAWFTEAGLSLQTIGAVTLLVIPYSFRFLWAPLFDHYKLPGLDRRRGWLLFIQMGLMITIIGMAYLTPEQLFISSYGSIPWLMLLGFITAMLATSQEIVVNAYQIEILPESERGLGAAIYVAGWRIGMLISSAFALALSKKWGWQDTYLCMALFMWVGILGTMIAPKANVCTQTSASFLYAFVLPFKDFFLRYGFKTGGLFLLVIVTYKASDALALALNTTFLLRQMGFDPVTVGLVNKTVSMGAALLGGVVAGIWMTKLSLYRALLVFGFIQGAANLGYVALAYFGKSLFLLVLTAFMENFCSGMGTIALLAFIMALCSVQYTATQCALLSAIAFLARVFVGPIAADMVGSIGWLTFFVVCFLISLPTLFFVYASKNSIEQLKSHRMLL